MLKLAMPTSSAAEDMYHHDSSNAMTFDSYLTVCTPPSLDADRVTFGICSSPGTLRNALRSFTDDPQLLQNTLLNISESCTRRSQSFRFSRQHRNVTCDSWRSCLSDPSIKLNRSEIPKKKVSFADDAGLNLTRVRLLSGSCDSLPIPDSGSTCITYSSYASNKSCVSSLVFVANFQQPVANFAGFLQKVEQHNVSLESILINGFDVRGTIKVKNVVYEKKVFIRYTLNRWNTHTDVECTYTNNNGSVNSSAFDCFHFRLIIPKDHKASDNIEFAICLRVNYGEFWDNNNGKNYEIIAKTAGPSQRRSLSLGVKRNLCLGV